jgi:hypothetical protein
MLLLGLLAAAKGGRDTGQVAPGSGIEWGSFETFRGPQWSNAWSMTIPRYHAFAVGEVDMVSERVAPDLRALFCESWPN